MKLHLLRHAKTNQQSETGRDFDRKLLPKGTQQALEMSDFLEKLENFEVHCSSSMRTRQTYELVAPKIPTANVHFWDDLYHASYMDLLRFITSLEIKKDILLIGHNEGISDLATYLTDQFISLKTCGYVCLEAHIASWAELSKGTATARLFYRPEVED